MTGEPATASGPPVRPDSSAPLNGLVTAVLLVGLASLGLPWGALAQPGYVSVVRVPVAAAGVLVILGSRHRSRRLVRVGSSLGLAAVVLAGFQGSGPLVMLLALLLLEAGVRRSPP